MSEQNQIQMYGDTVESMREGAIFTDLNDPFDLISYSQNILSDAQHIMATQPERANQWINKSKYFMSQAKIILRNK